MNRSYSLFCMSLSAAIFFASDALADCLSGNCQDGTGKATYTDGGVYEGSFKDGYRHGQGTYTWANKVKYVGNWDRGDQDGQGASYAADGNIIYSGAWSRGQQVTVAANTDGQSVTQTGQQPVGEVPQDSNQIQNVSQPPASKCVSGNCQDGFGTYIFADGEKYEGAFRGGKRDGMGTFTWNSGIKYVGQWREGSQHGQGAQFNADGSVFFDGSWDNGKQLAAADNNAAPADAKAGLAMNSCVSGDCQSGFGKYSYGGIGSYEGYFKNGVRDGQGTFTWNEGHKYIGPWTADKMSGNGSVTYSDGRKFEGIFKDGVRVVGTFTWADGSRYTGSFKEDRLGGQGVLQNADGSWYVGSFENDQRNGRGTSFKSDGSVDFMGTWKNNEKAPA